MLLLAATPAEIVPTVNWLRERASGQRENVLRFPRCEIEILFGGLGVMTTAFALGSAFGGGNPPGLAIQAGVGGAIDRSLSIGQVVNVTSDRLMDLGAEDADGKLLSPAALGFAPAHPFDEAGWLIPPGPSAILPYETVAGGTVNRATGTENSVEEWRRLYPGVQVESMEGAAFFYACMAAAVEALQLRAISNYVERRNRAAWDLPGAIGALNEALQRVLTPFID
nr:futalosine hydrolase [Lewinella sp. JB7]